MYWKETKYTIQNSRLVPTEDRRFLNGSSYLIAAITADYYSKYIPKYVKGTTADLGCGFAPMYQYYKKYADRVICIDWEKSLHKNKILDIRCDLSQTLPLENESIDTVILSDVLEHIITPKLLFMEIYRVLKSNGMVLLNTPFAYPEHEKPYDYFRYTEFFYRRMAKELGYEPVVIKKVGGEKEVIVTLIGKYLEMHWTSSIAFAKWINAFSYKCWKRAPQISEKGNICLGYFVVLKKREVNSGGCR